VFTKGLVTQSDVNSSSPALSFPPGPSSMGSAICFRKQVLDSPILVGLSIEDLCRVFFALSDLSGHLTFH